MVEWKCPKCQVEVDAGFDVCWQCGTAVDGQEDATFVPEVDVATLPEGFIRTIQCSACGYKGKIMIGHYQYQPWVYVMAGVLSLTIIGTAPVFAFLNFTEKLRFKLCPRCRRGDAITDWYGDAADQDEELWHTAQAREVQQFKRSRFQLNCVILASFLVPGTAMLVAWLRA